MLEITNKFSVPRICNFFRAICKEEFFQPHPMDFEGWVETIKTSDEYWFITTTYDYLAYGFIRGWGDKWDEKVVGVCVHPDLRGKGFGELMLRWLEKVAWERGLKSLRIHVSEKNISALNLYKKLNYIFDGTKTDKGDLIGRKKI